MPTKGVEDGHTETTTHSEDDKGTSGRGARWLPWHDRFVVREIIASKPFQAGKGKDQEEAWAKAASAIKAESRRQNTASVIDRSGDAVRAHIKKLLNAHRVRFNSLPLLSSTYRRIILEK